MQWKEIKRTVQDLKVEIEPMKKTQRECILEIKNVQNGTGNLELSLSNKIHGREESISSIEDM